MGCNTSSGANATPPVLATAKAADSGWWLAEVPKGIVVRKEIREMSAAEQERYAAAVLKMRENTEGPGSSLYFRLAAIHGGVPQCPKVKTPESPDLFPYEVTQEHCAHGRECFPTWHRPYVLSFERGLRRADLALGNDGMIGLPYWDWTQTEVNGEVLPGIVRKKLMEEFPEDFWPVGTDPSVGQRYRMSETSPDDRVRKYLDRARLGAMVDGCLKTVLHDQHACTAFGNPRGSVEQPHNNIHGFVGGIMGGFQSSFHPVFWLHHNNVDRIYTKYVEVQPDSAGEFERHQRLLGKQGQSQGTPGFPEGPWGPYLPFKNPETGKPFHVADCFDIGPLGYKFDVLPTVSPPEMRERPWFAVITNVDVRKLVNSRMVFLFALKPGAAWEPPQANEEAHLEHSAFVAATAIFFIDSPNKCTNCMSKEPFNLLVDITAALHEKALDPATVILKAVVRDVATGAFEPIDNTPLAPPVLRGPTSKELSAHTFPGFTRGEAGAGLLSASKKAGGKIAWYVDEDSVPFSLRDKTGELSAVIAELTMGFDKWSAGNGIAFERVAEAKAGKDALKITFDNLTSGNTRLFDGPGGKIAQAQENPPIITFDAAELWVLSTATEHPRKSRLSWDEVTFCLLPVALHEIGHVLGLEHEGAEADDVMSPFYDATKRELTQSDVKRVKALGEAVGKDQL